MATSKSFPPLTEDQPIEPDRIASVLECDPAQIKRIEVVHKSATITSTIRRVKITYAKAASDLPATIFVKHGRPWISDKFLGLGRHEVRFFSELLHRLPEHHALSLPHCYEAAHDGESGDWHLMLEDLDGTHFVTQWTVAANSFLLRDGGGLSGHHACEALGPPATRLIW